LSVAAEIVRGKLVSARDDVQGAMVGTATFDWKASGSRIQPGAICEHFTSFGGVMRKNAGQTPLSEFIRHGAAGASGTVTEPFAIPAKFPNAFLHVHYASGCCLAEAFYQSVSGPYQLLIVGDPLCQPWARIPIVRVEGITSGATVRGTVVLKPIAKNEPEAIQRFELFVDGMKLQTCHTNETFRLDTTLLPDGYHELRIVAVRSDSIRSTGRAVLTMNVQNQDQKLDVTGPDGKSIPFGSKIKLTCKLAGATRIQVWQNSRVVGEIHAESGQIVIDSSRLGVGLCKLKTVAKFENAKSIFGAPVTVHIVHSN
jgi:hypothetical protein